MQSDTKRQVANPKQLGADLLVSRCAPEACQRASTRDQQVAVGQRLASVRLEPLGEALDVAPSAVSQAFILACALTGGRKSGRRVVPPNKAFRWQPVDVVAELRDVRFVPERDVRASDPDRRFRRN